MAFERGEPFMRLNQRALSTSKHLRGNEVNNEEADDGFEERLLLSKWIGKQPILI